jgi:glycosyltransferase involved in cell wall biosynthesis
MMAAGPLFDLSNALPSSARRLVFSLLRSNHASSRRGPLRRLLLDVSVISRHDAGTGIQRVVRGIMTALLEQAPAGVEIQLIGETRKRGYCYLEWDGVSSELKLKGPVEPDSHSAFVGLDLSLDAVVRHYSQLAYWRTQGVSLHFVVYDLLPLKHAEWFTAQLVRRFRRWFTAVTLLADSVLTISRTVERDIQHRFCNSFGLNVLEIPTVVLPMGADFLATRPGLVRSNRLGDLYQHFSGALSVLMVGTLEPRKGHSQVLDAFHELWQQGSDVKLFIVGRPGWHTESLQARIRGDYELGKRLFWLDDASDEELHFLYQACHGVIIASFEEGFGLSFIEAMSYGKPVLARDIPVFREREQPGVRFFSACSGRELAGALAKWLNDVEAGVLEVMPYAQPRWRDTATSLVDWIQAIHSRGNESAKNESRDY